VRLYLHADVAVVDGVVRESREVAEAFLVVEVVFREEM
jgi:hypothetical protein